MRKDTGQVSKEALVDCEYTFRANCLVQTVKYTLVKVSGLVVQSRHDGIYRVQWSAPLQWRIFWK